MASSKMNLVVPASVRKAATEIKELCGFRSEAEAFTRSILFLRMYLREREAGNRVLVTNADGLNPRQLEVLFQ